MFGAGVSFGEVCRTTGDLPCGEIGATGVMAPVCRALDCLPVRAGTVAGGGLTAAFLAGSKVGAGFGLLVALVFAGTAGFGAMVLPEGSAGLFCLPPTRL